MKEIVSINHWTSCILSINFRLEKKVPPHTHAHREKKSVVKSKCLPKKVIVAQSWLLIAQAYPHRVASISIVFFLSFLATSSFFLSFFFLSFFFLSFFYFYCCFFLRFYYTFFFFMAFFSYLIFLLLTPSSLYKIFFLLFFHFPQILLLYV